MNQHHFAGFMEMTLGLVLGMLFGGGVNVTAGLSATMCSILMGIARLSGSRRHHKLRALSPLWFVLYFCTRSKAKEEPNLPEEAVRNDGRHGGLVIGVFVVIYLGGGFVARSGLSLGDTDISTDASWRTGVDRRLAHVGSGLDSWGGVHKIRYQNGLFRLEQA
jgi:hypothetical protein